MGRNFVLCDADIWVSCPFFEKITLLPPLDCIDTALQLHAFLAIGFNVETVTYKNLKFQVWDLGGQTSIRPYWRCYYSNTDAIIYVVDSVDKERMGISKQELVSMLEEEELKKAALLVFANKQDLPGALSAADVSKQLGLAALKNRAWAIFKTSAKKGDGLDEAMEWLVNALKGGN